MKQRKAGARLLSLLFALLIILPCCVTGAEAAGGREVYLGGNAFGVRFYNGVLTVSELSSVDTAKGEVFPAGDAGLLPGDEIISINGKKAESAEEITEAVEQSDGAEIEICYRRGESESSVKIKPVKSESSGQYRIGLWLRDSTAGIGTLTYIVPEKGGFGGLGHGICESGSGQLLKIDRGVVTDVSISGITKGEQGEPGELHGFFSPGKTGVVTGNTDCGVFGLLTDISRFRESGTLIETGTRDDLHEGEAKIRCTLDDKGPAEYSVTLSRADDGSGDGRSFSIKVTDEKLLAKTGGIVQGMSGSPVIQDGLLVGAVTHVLISDPTEGYGIYIENMTNEMPDILK